MIERGGAAVKAASDYNSEPIDDSEGGQSLRETCLGDALVNMRHWSDSHGFDWDRALEQAMQLHYEVERGTPLDQETPNK
jgi:hypothetical protein